MFGLHRNDINTVQGSQYQTPILDIGEQLLCVNAVESVPQHYFAWKTANLYEILMDLEDVQVVIEKQKWTTLHCRFEIVNNVQTLSTKNMNLWYILLKLVNLSKYQLVVDVSNLFYLWVFT